MYTTRFYIKKSYVLPTQWIYVFCMGLRTTALVSLYSINRLAYITGTKCVYCAVRGQSWIVIMINVLSRRPGFDPRPVHVRFVLSRVALWQVFLPVLRFSLSVSFHQCSTFTFIYMLLLSEEQTGAAWEPPKAMLFRKSENIG